MVKGTTQRMRVIQTHVKVPHDQKRQLLFFSLIFERGHSVRQKGFGYIAYFTRDITSCHGSGRNSIASRKK